MHVLYSFLKLLAALVGVVGLFAGAGFVILYRERLSERLWPTPEERLHFAVEDRDVAAVRRLLEGGVSANGKPGRVEPPLFGAIDAGDVELVRLLVAHGADQYSHCGRTTAISAAIERGGPGEVISLLLEHGADVTRRNERGETPAHLIAQKAERVPEELAARIVAAGPAALAVKDTGGKTPVTVHRLSGRSEGG
jgi:ankyrin repeat protein